MGAKSITFLNLKGGGPFQGEGTEEENNTIDSFTTPSVVFFAWSETDAQI